MGGNLTMIKSVNEGFGRYKVALRNLEKIEMALDELSGVASPAKYSERNAQCLNAATMRLEGMRWLLKLTKRDEKALLAELSKPRERGKQTLEEGLDRFWKGVGRRR